MEITVKQRQIIERKIGNMPCPLCGGSFLYFIQPFQLLSWKGNHSSDEALDLSQAKVYDYLCTECQNCGYTILRKLDVLLRNSNDPRNNAQA